MKRPGRNPRFLLGRVGSSVDEVRSSFLLDGDETGFAGTLQERGEILKGDLAGESTVEFLLMDGSRSGDKLDKIVKGFGFWVEAYLAKYLWHVYFKGIDESGSHFKCICVDDEFVGFTSCKDHGQFMDMGLFSGEVSSELLGGEVGVWFGIVAGVPGFSPACRGWGEGVFSDEG